MTEEPSFSRTIVRFAGWIAAIPAVALFLFLATIPVSDWRTQLWLGIAVFAVALLLKTILDGKRWVILTLISLSLFVTFRYAWWRATQTLGIGDPQVHWYEYPFIFILFGAEIYSWLILVFGYFQTAFPLSRKADPLPADIGGWPTVDIFIPTYNEPLSIVRATVLAAINIDWPPDKKRIYLLDDGDRREFEEFARTLGIDYLARPEHKHAKAGNLNFALSRSEGKYIAVFDCDHIPTRSFLQTTVGIPEKNPKVGFVQTPHHFYSPDPYERNLDVFQKLPNEGELFYGIIQDGNDLWNAATFCGSCTVIRREALDEIQGFAVDTVTEDAHTSLKLHRRGWESAYLNLPQAAGLATPTLSAHIRQRIRWARGMIQVFRIENPLFVSGLRLSQRLCYINGMLFFLSSLPRIVFLTAPLAYLYFGIRIFDADAYSIASFAFPPIALSLIANAAIHGKHRHSFWNQVYETTLAPYILLPTFLALINPRLGTFNVTAKEGRIEQAFYDRKIARPFVVLWLLNLGGLISGIVRYSGGFGEIPTILLTLAWTLHNLIIVGTTLAVSWERAQRRDRPRLNLNLPVRITGSSGQVLFGETEDFSDYGTRIRLAKSGPVSMREAVLLEVPFREGVQGFPAEIVGMDESNLRLNFQPLTLEEEQRLMLILYGRADAWVRFGVAQQNDSILKSLWNISLFALIGQGRVLKALLWSSPKPEIPKTRLLRGPS